MAAVIRQQPLCVIAAGNLIDAEKATLAKVDERSAEMADDNPADQDDAELSWP
jgi:hypothetical protein